MSITLFPHQEKGASFLASSYGTKGLFFGMGTGKTITALEAVYRASADRVIVIAPPIALPMWAQEADKVLNNSKHDGWGIDILKTGKSPLAELADCTLIVVSYTIAAKRAEELRDWLRYGDGGETGTSVLICDESHALKSATAKRTKAVLGQDGIADGAHHSWMLTGTPITRWNDDMFSFLCRADLKGLRKKTGMTKFDRGSRALERFQRAFCIRQKRQFPGARFPTWMVVGNQRTDELAEWVYGEGHALRVDIDEVFESMPPLTTRRYAINLDMDAELKLLLEDVKRMSLAEIEQKAKAKDPALATIRRRLGLAKVKAAAAEIIERIESGQNVLVGAWHTEVIDALAHALTLKSYTAAIIDGRTSPAQKQAEQGYWNAGKTQVLVCQIAAAGVSLNLQKGGSQIICVEEDWSPSIMDQFYARLWRYGQEKHVHVDTLVSETKLDEAVGRINGAKAREHAKFNEIGREITND